MIFQCGIAEAQFEVAESSDRSDTDTQHNDRSEADILVEVGGALGKIREIAQGSCDRILLYFIDMSIFQVCESLRSELNGLTRRTSVPLSSDATVG
jgi:hypothetical protein